MKEPEQIDRAKILRLAELVREHVEQSYNAERPLQFSEMALISRSCDEIGREISKQTEQPERHGRWILRSVQPDEYNNNFYECSICRATEKHNINVNVPYCWHCGAKMGDSEVETDTVARWEDAGINGTVKCSRCQFTDFFAKRDRVMLFQYCPGCGAKMDGGSDSGKV